MKLSIIIPVFNEKNTIAKIINKINNLKNLDKEIIVVDDFSNDGTTLVLKKSIYKKVNKIIYNKKNLGKGAAIKSAKKFISGDIIIIQDADLEYDPKDYYKLIKPFQNRQCQVVYGSRVLGKNRYAANNFYSIFRVFCNHILTILSNFINNQNLTDAHTCYKVFRRKVFNKINLQEKKFAFCPEVTTKLSLLDIDIKEVPISYNGRTFEEGKKISFKDGIQAIFALFKYRYLK